MASQNLAQQLLGLPDVETQRQFLEAHTSQLNDDVASALKGQADEFLRADLDRSLRVSELLLYLAKLTDDPQHRALGLIANAHARSFGGLGEYEHAVSLLNEAADIFQAHNRPVDAARAQIGKIWSLAQLGHYQEAFETGEWARRVFKKNGERLLLAKLTVNLGVIRRRLGEDAASLALFDQARDLYQELGADGEALKALARVEHNRSIVLSNLGRFEESIDACQNALDMLIRTDQTVEAARARQNLGITYFILGRYNEALELLDQARDLFVADGRQRDAVLVELFISDCLLQLRRFTDVLEKCRQIRERFSQLGTRREVALAALNEAVAYARLQRYVEAMASLSQARHLFEEENNRVWVASTDLEAAAMLYRHGRFQESSEVAQASAEVFAEYDLPVHRARASLIAAQSAVALDRRDLARNLTTQALSVGESRDVPSLVYQCHHLLGSLAQAQGDSREALAEYERAIQELERLRGRLMIEFRADFLEDKHAVYEDVVALCLDLGRPRRGLKYAERSKSRALLDLLAYRVDLGIRAKKASDRSLVEELIQLRSERDRLCLRRESDEELVVRGQTAPGQDQYQVQQDVLALEKRITELWHKLLIRNADYARDASLWHVRTEPIQRYLTPNTLLLEYFIVRGQIAVFLITQEKVQARYVSAGLSQIQRLTQLLWLNLRAVPNGLASARLSALGNNARNLLHQLHKLLIAPLEDVVTQYPQLIVVPHGPLHYLPLHACYNGSSFLLERHEISYLPGASLLRYCREAHPAASGALVFGYSYGGKIPWAVKEAHSIAAVLGEKNWVEEEATIGRLHEAASNSRVIHLATHGEFRPDNPLFSGLALADGWLTTLDIFNLHLNASLVTLSACQTGRNVVGGGDELLGLMRAFLYAGTASLLLSLWAVEDRSTAWLMENVYRKLGQGWGKGAALRHAQLQFIQGEGPEGTDIIGDLSHPYFWAPFFLVGDTGRA